MLQHRGLGAWDDMHLDPVLGGQCEVELQLQRVLARQQLVGLVLVQTDQGDLGLLQSKAIHMFHTS